MKINDDTTPIPKSDYGMIAHIVSWGSIGDRAFGFGMFVPEIVPYQRYGKLQFRDIKKY